MIDLTGLSFQEVQPTLLEFGGVQRGSLGGPSQQLNRLGNRWSFALALPPMDASTPWTSKIVRAKQEGAIIRISRPGVTISAGITPSVLASIAGGSMVPVTGLPANFAVPSTWVSFLHGGRRYAHLIDAAVSDQSGTATFIVTPMLRTPLSAGDAIELADPKAEGLLVDKLGWSIAKNRTIAFTLSLEEQR